MIDIIKNIILFIFSSLLSFSSLYSQDITFADKLAYSLNINLPKTTNNSSFKSTFNGIIDLDGHIHYKLFDNFEICIGYRYAHFQLNSVIFKDNITGKMENHTPILKMSWNKHLSNIVFLKSSLSVGCNFEITNTNIVNKIYYYNSFYFKPELALYMFSTEYLAFGIVFSYNTWLSEFSNYNIFMSAIPGMNANSYKGYSQTFCVGFGFYSLIPNKSQ